MSALLLWSMLAFAEYENLEVMNGMRLSDFEGFPEQWREVTVRYRRDNNEMRFIYANPVALKALKAGVTDFPDGSVFGKIGRVAEEDPSFPSSLVPSGTKRFQFMVRDKAKYKETNGWGYALFNERGLTFPGEPKAAAKACAACHQLVENRGYVFASLLDSPLAAQAVKTDFRKVAKQDLPQPIRQWLRTGELTVMSIQGRLREHVFQGTLDEVVPMLVKNSIKEKMPSLLLDKTGTRFSLVIFDRTSKQCAGKQAFMSVKSAPEMPAKIVKRTFCE